MNRLVGHYLSGIPDDGLAVHDLHLVGRLFHISFFRDKLPGEPWMGNTNAPSGWRGFL